MSRRVVVVTAGRNAVAGGLEQAEARLLDALRRRPAGGYELGMRVVGGRAARRYARRLSASWVPARPGTLPRRAVRGAELVHFAGLDFPARLGVEFAVTFHDLAALSYEDEGSLPPWAQELASRAAFIVCPSRFTSTELSGRLGVDEARVRIVPNGPGCEVSPGTPALDPDERRRLGLPDRYVLRLGGYTRRKNVGRLLEAWALARHELDAGLVLAGPPQPARTRLLAEAPTLEGVQVLDYVDSALLPRLIRSAAAVVTTSLYEGFGMTVLEAMSAGVPAVAVRIPAADEVCGDAALLVEDAAEPIAAALQRAVADEQFRDELIRRGLERARLFSWEASAALLDTAYAATVGG